MNRSMRMLRPIALLFAGLAATAAAQTHPTTGTLLSDRWHYPFNFTPGVRQTGSLFISPPPGIFQFNRRDGVVVAQWQVQVPAALSGQSWRVSQARISIWTTKDAAWPDSGLTTEGLTRRIEIFAAGFGPTYQEALWTGTQAYIGGDPTVLRPRDPYPRDLPTDAHDEDNLTSATPWAIGAPQPDYVPGAMTDAVRVDFDLNVDSPLIQAELRHDLLSGRSSWIFSGVFDTSGGPGGGSTTSVPVVILSEGVANPAHGTSQRAPQLTLELEAVSSANHWEMYR